MEVTPQPGRPRRALRWLQGHWQLLVLTGLLYAVWNTDLAWPLRILIVMFHEISHGIAALLTGGTIVEIELSPFEGGTAWTIGGSFFWVASSGYLGSLLIGLALFLGAIQTGADRVILALCGAALLLTAALYVRDSFSIFYCCSVGAIMIAIAFFLPASLSDMVLRLIGLTSMLYVPWDIYTDTIWSCPNCISSLQKSDAAAIASYSFGTEAMWGVVWLVTAIVTIAAALRFGLGSSSNLALRFYRSTPDPSPSRDDPPP